MSVLHGEDVALIPLEADTTELLEALGSMEAGRYREAIETLERALGRARALGEKVGVVQVPDVLVGKPGELRAALLALTGRSSRALEAAPERVGARPGRGPFQRPVAVAPPTLERGRRFLPLNVVVEAILGALPAEGLAVYRELNDGLARNLLATYRDKGDLEALRRVATELFYSSSGDDAAETLGDVAYLQGDYREALGSWRRVLTLYPDPGVPLDRVRAKILGALGMLGLRLELQHEVESMRQALAGDPTSLEALERMLPAEVATASPSTIAAPSRWGGEARAQPVTFSAGRGLQLSWDSWGWSERGVDKPLDRFASTRSSFGWEPETMHLPFCPLVDGDRLYLSSVFSLYRFDARPDGGAILAEVRKPPGTPPTGTYEEREAADSALYTTTLWTRQSDPQASWLAPPADEVLITSYLSDAISPTSYLGYDITVLLPIRSLVAYDAQSLRLLWKTGTQTAPRLPTPDVAGGLLDPGIEKESPEDLEDMEDLLDENGHGLVLRGGLRRRSLGGDENEGAKPRDFSYTSPAIVKAGRVVAGGWIQQGSINSALRALSLATGEVLWQTLLSGFQMEQTMFGEIAREPFAGAILEADGVVYYLNQGGVVTALELETGTVRWFVTYDTLRNDPSWQRQASRRALCWGPNPILLLGNILIVTPRDSDQLYAIDTGTGPLGPRAGGRILWKFANPLLAQGQAEWRDLAGFAAGRLYFTGPGEIRNGPSLVAALDLRGLDALGRLASGEVPTRLAPLRLDGIVSGPGQVTDEGILVATEKGIHLVALDLRSARLLTTRPYPPRAGRSYPGRLVIQGGSVYMVSRKLLSSHVSLAQ